jgi:hypothetical protein
VQLIIFTGLPGSGKSSIAEAAARELGLPVFAKDWLEATFYPFAGSGVPWRRLIKPPGA